MGPDCGTAVVAGVGLGFANVVRPGPVGLVAASGTGAQQVMACSTRRAWVSGTAGRRRAGPVGRGRRPLGAARARPARRRPAVELVVLVSKPPAPEVESALGELPPRCRRRCTPRCSAPAARTHRRGGAGRACPWPRLAGAAVVAGAGRADGALPPAWWGPSAAAPSATRPCWWPRPRWVRWRSNIPLAGAPRVGPDAGTEGHVFVDFGDDELTRGRPHPMIDNSLRPEWIGRQAREGRSCSWTSCWATVPTRIPPRSSRPSSRPPWPPGRGGRRLAVRHERRPAGPRTPGGGPAGSRCVGASVQRGRGAQGARAAGRRRQARGEKLGAGR